MFADTALRGVPYRVILGIVVPRGTLALVIHNRAVESPPSPRRSPRAHGEVISSHTLQATNIVCSAKGASRREIDWLLVDPQSLITQCNKVEWTMPPRTLGTRLAPTLLHTMTFTWNNKLATALALWLLTLGRLGVDSSMVQ